MRPRNKMPGSAKVVGGFHDRVPQLACLHGGMNPQAICALVGALGQGPRGRARAPAPTVPSACGLDERIGHADRHVEVVPAASVRLAVMNSFTSGVVDAQHAHLRATARARAFDRGAGLVEHIDVAAGPRRHGMVPLTSAPRGGCAKVITTPPPRPHGFGRFAQGFVNAGASLLRPRPGCSHPRAAQSS